MTRTSAVSSTWTNRKKKTVAPVMRCAHPRPHALAAAVERPCRCCGHGGLRPGPGAAVLRRFARRAGSPDAPIVDRAARPGRPRGAERSDRHPIAPARAVAWPHERAPHRVRAAHRPPLRPGVAGRLGRRRAAGRAGGVPVHPRGLPARCTPGGRGRCASTPASAPPWSPTPATGSCSPPARPGCRSPSTCRPRWATTATTRSPAARSARSASRSTRSTTCGSCSTASRWTRSRPR